MSSKVPNSSVLLPSKHSKSWFIFYRSKPCKFFPIGKCRYGRKCRFRHDSCDSKIVESINQLQHRTMETGKELHEFKEIINEQNKIMKMQALEIQNLKKSLENFTTFISAMSEKQLEFNSQQFENQSERIKAQTIEISKIQKCFENHWELLNIFQSMSPQQACDSNHEDLLSATASTSSLPTQDANLSPLVSREEQKLCGLCNIPAKLRCTRCKKVHYCSSKHQAEHWKHHKKKCNQDKVNSDVEDTSMTLKQHLINVRDQFSTPVSDEDFESLLKEIEDDELTKIGI